LASPATRQRRTKIRDANHQPGERRTSVRRWPRALLQLDVYYIKPHYQTIGKLHAKHCAQNDIAERKSPAN
jgi:hypothetical protein